MARSSSFRYQLPGGAIQLVDVSEFHSISIYFRFPDGAKIIALEGFDGNHTIPETETKNFLHWLAEI
jgi:hypothetical protein